MEAVLGAEAQTVHAAEPLLAAADTTARGPKVERRPLPVEKQKKHGKIDGNIL